MAEYFSACKKTVTERNCVLLYSYFVEVRAFAYPFLDHFVQNLDETKR